ncbi:MAG: GTPase ObgE, partial [Limisphaerales bacterium]
MFVDQIKIYAQAGHGGKGAIAFHREACIPKGGPSGGNGGRGGSVILVADHDLNNLIEQFYNPRRIAESGEGGKGKGMDGHAGADLIIKVPCGTMVWKLPSKPPEIEQFEETEEEPGDSEEEKKPMMLSSNKREVIRHSGSERAMEINLEEGEA